MFVDLRRTGDFWDNFFPGVSEADDFAVMVIQSYPELKSFLLTSQRSILKSIN